MYWIELVARDGIEPPTPAFSGLPDQQLTDTFVVFSKRYRRPIWTPFGLQDSMVFGLRLDSRSPTIDNHLDSTSWYPACFRAHAVAASGKIGVVVVRED